MGGPGSGTWYRDRVPTVEDYNAIDARRWQREGLLEPGGSFTWRWYIDRELASSIRVFAGKNSVELRYRHRDRRTCEEYDIQQHIPLTYTTCNYGGLRTWFRCPQCRRRVALLYGAGKYFYCRHCYRLPYASQGDGRQDRLRSKARKIRQRLGAPMDLTCSYYERPKGMHRKTFRRLRDEEQRYTAELLRCGPYY